MKKVEQVVEVEKRKQLKEVNYDREVQCIMIKITVLLSLSI